MAAGKGTAAREPRQLPPGETPGPITILFHFHKNAKTFVLTYFINLLGFVHVCMLVYLNACGGQRATQGVIPQNCHPLYFKTGSFIGLELSFLLG